MEKIKSISKVDVLIEKSGLKVLCLSFIIKAKLKNDFLKIWYNKSFSKMAWKGVGRFRESRALIGYPMTHWAPPPRAPRTPQNALKYYTIESDFDLMTLAQKLINKSFSKMPGKGFGMYRGSRAFIWYPIIHIWPHIIGQEVNWMTNF